MGVYGTQMGLLLIQDIVGGELKRENKYYRAKNDNAAITSQSSGVGRTACPPCWLTGGMVYVMVYTGIVQYVRTCRSSYLMYARRTRVSAEYYQTMRDEEKRSSTLYQYQYHH